MEAGDAIDRLGQPNDLRHTVFLKADKNGADWLEIFLPYNEDSLLIFVCLSPFLSRNLQK